MKHMLINACAALCLIVAGTALAGDKAAMIASALSAGPASVTDNATVKDHEGNVLKQGSNGYTCSPAAPTEDAACNQGQWNELGAAMMKKEGSRPIKSVFPTCCPAREMPREQATVTPTRPTPTPSMTGSRKVHTL